MEIRRNSAEAVRQMAEIDEYLRNNYGMEVRNNVFKEFDRLLGIDVSGKIAEYVEKKVLDWAFQSELPLKIWKKSINLFRSAFFNLQARAGQAQEGTNIYSPRLDPALYADFTIWTWKKKGTPWYEVRQYI